MLREIQTVMLATFGIAPSLVDKCLVLKVTGIGDIVAVNSLRDCLAEVEQNIALDEITSVEFDIRRVQLLDSSCLKLLAAFLLKLSTLDAKCPIQFVVDSKMSWQARSLFALQRLADGIVSIVPR